MTEQELRNKVASIMLGWEGAVRGDSRHAEILSIYNSHKPLARGYTVQKNDAYCATTASAAYIKAGIAAYTGTECGVGQWVEIARKKGIWVENDAHVPKVGDAICYDWDDTGTGENLGYPDHVGIVISASGSSFVVIEGNINGGKVGRRNMQVNGRYIRGFICPDFKAIAAELSGGEVNPDTPIQDDVETPTAAATTCTVTLPVLRYGSRNGHVKTCQVLLNHYFGAGLAVDGYYGRVTEKAVKAYQTARRLESDGIVGPITWAQLLK